LRLRRSHLWVIAPLALIWLFQSLPTIEPFDFWWNVTSGRIMLGGGQFAFLGSDVLVYTPVREPYSNPQWGAQILFYAIYNLSPLLMLTVRTAIITGTYAVLFVVAWRASSSRPAAAVATLLAYLTGFTNYGMRPQLFAFLPFIGFFWTLERAFGAGYGGPVDNTTPQPPAPHPRPLWLLPPLMIVWVNVHGSFFLGLFLIGAYVGGWVLTAGRTAAGRQMLLSRATVGWALPLGVTALATLVNPYTWNIYSYVAVATGDPTARALNIEWQPPTLYNGTGILFYANIAIVLAGLLLSRRAIRPTEVLLWLAFGGLALLSIRNVIWWGWVSAPGLALGLAALAGRLRPAAMEAGATPAPSREIPVLNWLLAGGLLIAALAATPLWRDPATALDKSTPTAVARFLADGTGGTGDAPGPPPGPLFNYMEWGGYLEWVLYPQQQVFIDGRFEARRAQVWQDYLAISRGAATWSERLASYGVRTLVLNKVFHADLIPLVQADPHWHPVYADAQAIVFTAR
jgi:hypothetical protein